MNALLVAATLLPGAAAPPDGPADGFYDQSETAPEVALADGSRVRLGARRSPEIRRTWLTPRITPTPASCWTWRSPTTTASATWC